MGQAGLNQPPPLGDYNAFAADRVLSEAVDREGADWADDRLAGVGALAGSEEVRHLGRLGGDELKEALSDVNRLLNVLVITDDDVEAQNRVVRSSLPGDEQGPIPKVIFNQRKRSARTLANREYCADKAARLLRAAGARQVFRLDWPPLILHVQSTMRMGRSADDSVLDPTGEARFVKRLFVASNSALANCLGGPNPTLTNQALSTRTAEKSLGKYFDAEPFVGRESPVSSIDDRVTRAVLDRRI